MKLNTLLRGVGLLLVAAMAWGGLFPIAQTTLESLDPFYMTAIRYGITAVILLALLAAVEGRAALRLDGNTGRLAVLGSFGFAGLGLLVFIGLQYSRPEHGGIIMATQPLIAALVVWLLRGTRPAKSTLGFLGVALAGVVLVITKGHFTGLFGGGTGWGDVLMLFGAVSWVIYTLGATEFPTWSPLRYTALTCVMALPTIFGIALVATASGYATVPSSDGDRFRRLATGLHHRHRIRAGRPVLERGQQDTRRDPRRAVHQFRAGHRIRDSHRARSSLRAHRVPGRGAGDRGAHREQPRHEGPALPRNAAGGARERPSGRLVARRWRVMGLARLRGGRGSTRGSGPAPAAARPPVSRCSFFSLETEL